jgi:hypothetical protein
MDGRDLEAENAVLWRFYCAVVWLDACIGDEMCAEADEIKREREAEVERLLVSCP